MRMDYDCKALNDRLIADLRPTTAALAMKYCRSEVELQAIPDVHILRDPAGVCTVIGLSAGFMRTVAVRKGNCSVSCAGANGVCDERDTFLSGERLSGVYPWHSSVETARQHIQAALADLPAAEYTALAVSPLALEAIPEPDVILLSLEPGAAFHLLAGYQHHSFDELTFQFRGESCCLECWCHTLVTGRPGLSLGCRGERGYGGLAANELRVSMRPESLSRALDGVESMARLGIRYPYYPCGTLELPPCE